MFLSEIIMYYFSYLGDENYIANKLISFSHVEYNTEDVNNTEEIKRKIEEGISLWGESHFKFVPIDKTFPKYVQDNQKLFEHLIHKL